MGDHVDFAIPVSIFFLAREIFVAVEMQNRVELAISGGIALFANSAAFGEYRDHVSEAVSGRVLLVSRDFAVAVKVTAISNGNSTNSEAR